MTDEWMIAGAALAYALATPVILWLFADRVSHRVATSTLALAAVLYLAVMGVENAKVYFASFNNLFLNMPAKAFSQYTMLTTGYRAGAYNSATTVAVIGMVILIWDRWPRQSRFRSTFVIAAVSVGSLIGLNYVPPLASQLFNAEVRGIGDLFIALADIVFLIWAFVVIARSETLQRFLSHVPENKT